MKLKKRKQYRKTSMNLKTGLLERSIQLIDLLSGLQRIKTEGTSLSAVGLSNHSSPVPVTSSKRALNSAPASLIWIINYYRE